MSLDSLPRKEELTLVAIVTLPMVPAGLIIAAIAGISRSPRVDQLAQHCWNQPVQEVYYLPFAVVAVGDFAIALLTSPIILLTFCRRWLWWASLGCCTSSCSDYRQWLGSLVSRGNQEYHCTENGFVWSCWSCRIQLKWTISSPKEVFEGKKDYNWCTYKFFEVRLGWNLSENVLFEEHIPAVEDFQQLDHLVSVVGLSDV